MALLTPQGKLKLEQKLKEIQEKLEKIQKLDRSTTTSWGGSFEKERLQNEMYLITEQEREIKEQLRNAQIEEPTVSNKITVGTTTKLLVNKEEVTYTFVSAPEADPIRNLISIESPVGQAVSGKKETDVISITIPTGTLTITVLEINSSISY